MFNKLTQLIENYLSKPSKRIADHRYVKAIYESFLTILPILLAGAFFLIVSSLLQFCAR
ncbi:MAG TPA: hypothetical protein VK048_00040 [Atopostipes sp.]|nr:hypothetical protein [Atopostipes sp.]